MDFKNICKFLKVLIAFMTLATILFINILCNDFFQAFLSLCKSGVALSVMIQHTSIILWLDVLVCELPTNLKYNDDQNSRPNVGRNFYGQYWWSRRNRLLLLSYLLMSKKSISNITSVQIGWWCIFNYNFMEVLGNRKMWNQV